MLTASLLGLVLALAVALAWWVVAHKWRESDDQAAPLLPTLPADPAAQRGNVRDGDPAGPLADDDRSFIRRIGECEAEVEAFRLRLAQHGSQIEALWGAIGQVRKGTRKEEREAEREQLAARVQSEIAARNGQSGATMTDGRPVRIIRHRGA